MKFTHLVEINMLDNPLVMMISREQLWHGLVLRSEKPTLFVLGLDACEITSRSPAELSRTLRFGTLMIHDQVRFTPQQLVHYHVPQQAAIPASDLTMTIEEPQPGALFVRFEYDDHSTTQETDEESFYNEFRREAYKEADIDTVRVIRELAQQGRLDTPLQ
ncbi:MAG: SRPBCC family protein [Burkholderiaceae bacterium]